MTIRIIVIIIAVIVAYGMGVDFYHPQNVHRDVHHEIRSGTR
jgi:hypothetical protein